MAAVYDEVLARGMFSWQQMWNGQPVSICAQQHGVPRNKRPLTRNLARPEQKPDEKNGCCTSPLVHKGPTCATTLRALCSADSPAQTRAMTYSFTPGGCKGDPGNLTDADQDIANFLLVRGPCEFRPHAARSACSDSRATGGAPYATRAVLRMPPLLTVLSCLPPPSDAWLGHGWLGCSREYEVPELLNADFGVPTELCSETAPGSQIFTRKWTKADIQMDCNTWTPTITLL